MGIIVAWLLRKCIFHWKGRSVSYKRTQKKKKSKKEWHLKTPLKALKYNASSWKHHNASSLSYKNIDSSTSTTSNRPKGSFIYSLPIYPTSINQGISGPHSTIASPIVSKKYGTCRLSSTLNLSILDPLVFVDPHPIDLHRFDHEFRYTC